MSISTPGPAFTAQPLSPIVFLERAANAYGDRVAYSDSDHELSYMELFARAQRLAGWISAKGVEPGERVSILAPNSHVMLEAHFGVPGSGAVLNALNTRLSLSELTHIVRHAGTRLLICDEEYIDMGRKLVDAVDQTIELVEAGDSRSVYEVETAQAPEYWATPADELALLSLNYTSGTTGSPKGVMYAHRGAYLQALAMVAQGGLDAKTVFLWTLPMFHCNGWCFPWAVTAVGGRHVGMREVRSDQIWTAIRSQGVTHFNAAPTVLNGLVNADSATKCALPVRVATGGAPPSPTLLEQLDAFNIHVTHLYGLTETYGPAAICDWAPKWDALDLSEQASLKARQGVPNLIGSLLRVVDENGVDTPRNGSTRGEVIIRGNNVMLGYFNDAEATSAASLESAGSVWFRTGDIAVMHPDNYIELRDRAKDVIISGGENIGSVEVEQAIDTHPDVLESAVVAAPDPYWGEVPVAFVSLRDGTSASESEIIEHVKTRIARYKAPKRVTFGPLPRTSTGKVQKFLLRNASATDHSHTDEE